MLENCSIADRFTYRVHSAAIDQAQRLTIPALVRDLQMAAMRNSVRLGFSVFELEKQQLGWVLLSQRIELKERPKLEETYEVLTCATGFDRLFTYRDFHLFNQQGEQFGTVATAWMMLDLQQRRSTKVPSFIIDRLSPYFPPEEDRLPRAKRLKLPAVELEASNELHFRVGYHQLDFNGHLSNPFYLEWGLEGLPQVLLSRGNLRSLEIEYKKEAVYGQRLTVQVEALEGTTYLHRLSNEQGEILAQMRSHW
ncbi:MAG: acyl-ACP thioesterase domain-containing protein [Bacteroidota bacterium]